MRFSHHLGRRLLGIILIAMVLFGAVAPAMAQTVFRVPQGGTGRSTFTSNAIVKGAGTGALAPSGVSIDSSNNITGANNLTLGSDTFTLGPAGSGARYIANGSDDDIEMNDALSDCAADDECKEVYVLSNPDSYSLDDLLRIPNDVALRCAGIDQVVIRAEDNYTPTDSALYNTYSSMMVVADESPAQNIVIEGCTFDHNVNNKTGLSDSGQHQAVSIWNATNVVFRNNKITNGINWSLLFMDVDGFAVDHNIVLGGASTTYTQNDGLHFRSSQNGSVTNNYVDTFALGGTSGDDAIAVGTGNNRGNQETKAVVVANNNVSGRNGMRVLQEGSYAVRDVTLANNNIFYAFRSAIIVTKYITGSEKLYNINITGNNASDFGNDPTSAIHGEGVYIESESPYNVVAFKVLNIVGNTFQDGDYADSGWGIRGSSKIQGLNISNNTFKDLAGLGCIRLGGDSRPVKDAVVVGNSCDITGSASSAEGIRAFGTERGVFAGNTINGHTTGTTYCIALRAQATAGNDNDGVPRLESSLWNNVYGNTCSNFDSGVAELNNGANPNNNKLSNNAFNTVTTPYTTLGAGTLVSDFTGTNFNFNKGVDIRAANITTASATQGNFNVGTTDAQAADVGASISLGGYNDDAAATFRVFGTVEGRKLNSTTANSSGYLSFKANGGGTLSEKMRIDGATGFVSIGGGVVGVARLTVTESTLGSAVAKLLSSATNDDPAEIIYQNRAATTDNAQTTLHTFTLAATTTYQVECNVTGRRTGGSSGTAEDSAGYKMIGTYKNVSGTATVVGSVDATYTAEDQAGWDATLTVTGATALVRVTGATNINVTWHSTCHVWQLSS